MISFVTSLYILQILVVVVLALLSWFVFDKRFRRDHGKVVPPGFQPTAEVFVDPTSNKKFRVYYNRNSGQRFYHEEN